MYHKVDLRPRTMWWVSVDAFHRQMADLQAYEVVYLDDYEPSNPRHVVITFDGPYEDVFTHAAPILERWRYPFELFVIGDRIGRPNDFDGDEPAARFASIDQLKALVALGARLQWHTRTHARLDAALTDRLEHELSVPDELSTRFPRPHFSWFAYPHGGVEADVAARVAERFTGAVACEEKADNTRYKLRRTTVVESSRFAKSSVAVIVPNYNYGCFVGEAIESVLCQTIMPDEILVIDDGSTDESLDLIQPYAQDVRIVANGTNLGIVDTFRKAVSATKADYIAFVGADNRIRCDYVERCRAALDANPKAGVAYTDVVLFGPRAAWHAGRVRQTPIFDVAEIFCDSGTGERMYRWSFPDPSPEVIANIRQTNFIHGSSMYRRMAYEGVGGYRKVDIAEDKDLFERILKSGWGAVHVPHPLLEYRQHSATQRNISLGLEQALAMQRREVRRLMRRVAELEQECKIARKALDNGVPVPDGGDQASSPKKPERSQFSEMQELSPYATRERNARVAELARALVERDGRIEALGHAINQKDALIQHVQTTAVHLNHRLRQARASLGWRLFWPARMMRGLLARLRRKIRVDLVPVNELQAAGAEWCATGNDPQFLLIAERNWPGLAGWCWLEVDSVSARPMNAQLYFDVGTGFDVARVINFQLSGKGSQRIPLYIAPKCHAIRLDPCDAPATFTLSVPGIRRLKEAPELPPEFLGQFTVYEALGGREGNAAALEPAGGVVPDGGAEYDWRSEGADPRFVVKRASQKLRPGWCMIELRMRSDSGRGNAKLYFDHGQGYSESASVLLPFRSGQLVERLFHLETLPKQVRFDPVEGVGKFSVERLDLAPARPMFARNSMLRRLCSHCAGYKNQSIGRVWRDLQAQAKTKQVAAQSLLFQRYNETFPAIGPHDAVSYAEWIAEVETAELFKLRARAKTHKRFRLQPTVSLVMPVYNTPEGFLRQAIASVQAQTYPRWELCIADDASPEPHVRAVIEEHARRDPRIKLIFRPENGHISAASNSALALATGDYVALMDHDDELAPHALHFVVEGINRNPSALILYSDEDKIDETGNRSEPHFKPDWNPDLFLSQNYVSHLGVYRRELLQRIGGFRLGVEGSQDYDLLLRCLHHVQPGEIVHIPMVLYHWRTLEGSTALGSEEKHYTTGAGIKALQEFFSAGGRPDVQVEAGLVPNAYRVRYSIPQPAPLVSLLIPTRDKLELLEPCVRSILDKTTYQNYEIDILDNGSIESSTLAYFKRIQSEDTRVRVLPYPYPFNFPAINNFGVRHARGELVGLVNNDIAVISPDWLTEMVSHALRPEIGCVGAKLYYDDETIQHAGVIIGLGGVAGHSHKYFPRAASGYFHRLKLVQNLSAVTAACLVVRKAIYEQVGGLEETGLGIAFNDVDFCLKVREAGYRNLWTPYAELYHHESKSRGAEDTPEKVERFNRETEFIKTKWGEALRRDPCYSPHLTLAREDFSLGGLTTNAMRCASVPTGEVAA